MSKIKNQKTENLEIMETLTETVVPTETQEISETLTPDAITEKIRIAKKELNELEIQFDFDENNAEIVAKELLIDQLKNERKTLVKSLEKQKLENEFNEKLATAKQSLCDVFGITNEVLESIIADAKNPDAKSTLISDFGLVFGKKPLFIAENVTGSNLAKGNAKNIVNGEQKVNITKGVKEMLTAGNAPDEIVNFILANSDMDETKAKKRLNDVRWGWEIENGLREKPKK
jgi:hypothetical protein